MQLKYVAKITKRKKQIALNQKQKHLSRDPSL